MKFALVNNARVEATKGAEATCPNCGSKLIAKCGEMRMSHWAHKGERNCDPWWEPETEWHRRWKNAFSIEWQENALFDERTGEKHIADVRTADGLILEFQHSAIAQKERTSREQFYKSMAWIVDGSRLKRDRPRFLKGQSNWRNTGKAGVYLVSFPEECFPALWLDSAVPVLFDFLGTDLLENPGDLRNSVYCLFPGRVGRQAVIVVMTREQFITIANNGNWLKWVDNFMNGPSRSEGEQQTQPSQPSRARRREPRYILERGRWVKRRRL
jgi:competence protein CoiA